eukprot:341169-Prymnesium_polylepis.1
MDTAEDGTAAVGLGRQHARNARAVCAGHPPRLERVHVHDGPRLQLRCRGVLLRRLPPAEVCDEACLVRRGHRQVLGRALALARRRAARFG